ncbi:MAG TPA: bifunctional folylpolyglutamate synthase/dihydrofolate synthase, partial [Saprospiraceae bacterium]|nr:bifunctional folylpolyglutamate synthase/dihydrofolate synthase [Saprospiraceae bacterium]
MTLSEQYKATIDYMYTRLPMFQRIGSAAYKKDLTNIRALCDFLGQPQQQYKTIHVAGTNGKGSVSHMLSAIFQQKGLKTGLYVSPHYKDYRERIKVNGRYVSKRFVIEFIDKLRPIIEQVNPSFFEINVAMAFEYFRQQKVDMAI